MGIFVYHSIISGSRYIGANVFIIQVVDKYYRVESSDELDIYTVRRIDILKDYWLERETLLQMYM